MTRRVLLSFLAIVAVVLLALELPLATSYARDAETRLFIAAERDAGVIAATVEEALEHGASSVELAPELAPYVEETGARVLVVDRDGISVADTAPLGPDRRDYSTRPEIAAALRGERASGTRASETVGEPLAYVAVPVRGGDQVYGAVRLTLPRSDIDEDIREYWFRLALVGVGVLAATTAVGIGLARWVTAPLSSLAAAVGRIASGDLSVRADADRGPPEVRILASEVNTMAARLQALMGSQEAFVADASHQLRSPLAALRLELENLQEGLHGGNLAAARRAETEVQRLARSVDGLLALARAERSQPALHDIDVRELVTERVAVWSEVAAESGGEVHLEPGGLVTAAAVPDHVSQILDNLLDNALRFTPDAGVVEVRVAQDAARHVIVEVRDHGPGLSDEQRERAFERFWRASGQDRGSGTGLGLPIARRLARSIGGDVTLESAPGGGTIARLELRASLARTSR